MIPIKLQPEPSNFDSEVRILGNSFLSQVPNPTYTQFSQKAFWQKSIPDLRLLYDNVCAYTAHWLPPGLSNATVDHFYPKSTHKNLAYEWSNYRLTCAQVNTNKGDFSDVLDPFSLNEDWFVIDFWSLLIIPNSNLADHDRVLVQQSINRLKLNDEKFLILRQTYLSDYCAGDTSFIYLTKNALFIGYELRRQNLMIAIKEIW